jgi:hypothetical protein
VTLLLLFHGGTVFPPPTGEGQVHLRIRERLVTRLVVRRIDRLPYPTVAP